MYVIFSPFACDWHVKPGDVHLSQHTWIMLCLYYYLAVYSYAIALFSWLMFPCQQQMMSVDQASQWHEMYCHDLDVMSSSPDQAELGVRGTSVLSRTWTKHTIIHSLLTHFSVFKKKAKGLMAIFQMMQNDANDVTWITIPKYKQLPNKLGLRCNAHDQGYDPACLGSTRTVNSVHADYFLQKEKSSWLLIRD